jgi:ubiquinone/menaquinone biosynthesis C-methylase UbiE
LKQDSIHHYRCPADKTALSLVDGKQAAGEIVSGTLVSPAGRRYPIERGLPNLIHPAELSAIEAKTKAEYDRVADEIYDRAVDWQFKAFHEDEDKVRETMVDLLQVQEGMRVLEVGCGTGRDSFRLARRLGRGELHMQDLSPAMVGVCRHKMAGFQKDLGFTCTLEYSASNASWLPYPDGYFDALFHFGGFNHFADLKIAAAELTRVVRKGGRVLFGDEAVAPWLKGTEFDGIVSTNNPLFKENIPLAVLPVSARDVTVRWLIANCFYVIAYTRGEDGPPPLDLDLPHTGVRGGSMRSRYFGVMEGVTPDTKERVRQAAAKAGTSIHDWLEGHIRAAADKELGS